MMQPDTRKLLITGSAIFFTGAVAALLLMTALGGVNGQGPHNNPGWLALMIAMGCVPTGTLTLALGLAKWVGDLRR
jgi:ABC-type multidrug transport system permease subunit